MLFANSQIYRNIELISIECDFFYLKLNDFIVLPMKENLLHSPINCDFSIEYLFLMFIWYFGIEESSLRLALLRWQL